MATTKTKLHPVRAVLWVTLVLGPLALGARLLVGHDGVRRGELLVTGSLAVAYAGFCIVALALTAEESVEDSDAD
ncbi:hypothetical protein ABIE44_002656 [Marmoricola sp. OAE513]|uniref:hypothetical protein n=1 Tax=Marmoricola sp. OAE513 TaxID=2817894 RepID=UPI001AEA9B87